MVVITLGGRRIVLTGWRAWLAGIAVFVAATVFLAVVAFVVLGIALTLGAILMIAAPIAIGVAILASLFRSQARDERRR